MSYRRFAWQIPNPKTGHLVNVVARGFVHDSLYVYAEDIRGQSEGFARVTVRVYSAANKLYGRWCGIYAGEGAEPTGRGYGLAAYLVAALAAAEIGKQGIVSHGRNPQYSGPFWRALVRNGLAECTARFAQPGDAAVLTEREQVRLAIESEGDCYLFADRVKQMLGPYATPIAVD